MKTLKILLICAVALIAFAGCESDELDEAYYASHATITSSDSNFTSDSDGGTIHFKVEGGEVTILVSCDTEWKVVVTGNFGVRIENIENSCYLTVGAEQNLFEEEQTGTMTFITVASLIEFATITVTQDGLAYITLSDEELLLSNSKGSISVNVESNFEWTYNCDADWLTITKPTSGGTMKIAYTANATGFDRETFVTITAGDGASNVAETELKITQSWENIDALILEYTVTDNNITIRLPICDVTNASIDWDDGTTTTTSSNYPSHTYSTPGIYTVTINGTVKSLSYSSYTTSSEYLTAVKQWGNTGLTNMKGAFYRCKKLTSLPEGAGPFSDVTSFSEAFRGCALPAIPENIFSNCRVATSFYECFYDCYSLENVPDNLFSGCLSATDFSYCFRDCSSLKSIPDNLFSGCSAATSFSCCFYDCSSLESIPDNLFSGCPSAADFSKCFNFCTSLESIPGNLFSGCPSATDFTECFRNCSSLESVSDNLFSGCSAATNFDWCFRNCPALKSVPDNLFSGCSAATSFSCCFYDCSSLESVSDNLFSGCSSATDFSYCFYNCSSLKSVSSGLFDDALQVTNFGYTFYGCSSVSGESPYVEIEIEGEKVKVHLYERSDYAPIMRWYNPTGDKCFRGSTFSDKDSIPSDWK